VGLSLADLEPLLTDDRVGKIHDLLWMAYPMLPVDTDVISFMVPEQESNTGTIPPQAVFALVSDNPRQSFDPLYRGKREMTTAGIPFVVWESDQKMRGHFVSGREDPAFKFYNYAARIHLRKLQDLRELI
jgi:hypothetical protein